MRDVSVTYYNINRHIQYRNVCNRGLQNISFPRFIDLGKLGKMLKKKTTKTFNAIVFIGYYVLCEKLFIFVSLDQQYFSSLI